MTQSDSNEPTPPNTPTSPKSAEVRASGLASHVVPYVLFLVVTQIAQIESFGDFGPVVTYPIKLLACTALVIWFARKGSYPELRTGFSWRLAPVDVAVGVAVFVLWVGAEGIPYPRIGESSYDPGAAGEAWRIPNIAVRLLGAVLLVPVIEELFMRSFLVRYVDTMEDGNWRAAPIGRFTVLSFAAVAILFGLAHHRWLVAILTGVIFNLYTMWRRALWPVIVVHAVTNLALGIYVLQTGRWTFW